MLEIISSIMVHPKIMAFLGQMEIIEVEIIGFLSVDLKITMKEATTWKEMHQMTDTMFVLYAVSQHTIRNIVM